MATFSYLAKQEQVLIDYRNGMASYDETVEAIENLIAAFDAECQYSGGYIYRENRDIWGTIQVNATVLRNRIIGSETFILDRLHELTARLHSEFGEV
jgi:hypothetical protein